MAGIGTHLVQSQEDHNLQSRSHGVDNEFFNVYDAVLGDNTSVDEMVELRSAHALEEVGAIREDGMFRLGLQGRKRCMS